MWQNIRVDCGRHIQVLLQTLCAELVAFTTVLFVILNVIDHILLNNALLVLLLRTEIETSGTKVEVSRFFCSHSYKYTYLTRVRFTSSDRYAGMALGRINVKNCISLKRVFFPFDTTTIHFSLV